jgi:hypothetical protein
MLVVVVVPQGWMPPRQLLLAELAVAVTVVLLVATA